MELFGIISFLLTARTAYAFSIPNFPSTRYCPESTALQSSPASDFDRSYSQVERPEETKMSEVVDFMLYGSDLIYALSTLRKRGDALVEALGWGVLNEYELIRTDRYEGENKYSNRRLKYSLTATAVQKFIELNRAWVHEVSDFNSDPSSPNNIEAVLDIATKKDIEVIELDDLREYAAPAYGITINRSEKRITVIFRGTNNDHDVKTDLQLYRTKITTPPKVKSITGLETVRIHNGFRRYLGLTRGMNDTSVCNRIIDLLDEAMQDEDLGEYQLFVTGHSLGGALAQLFSYKVAGDTRFDKYPNIFPVTCISFASPPVGNEEYDESFRKLEEEGLLRHIRFTNQGDPVTVTMPWFEQSGLTVNYRKSEGNATRIEYNTKDRFVDQLFNMWYFGSKFPFIDPLHYHAMKEYISNTKDRSDVLFGDKTVSQFWDEHVGGT